MALAPQVPVKTEVQTFPLEQANEALDRVAPGPDPGRGGAGSERVKSIVEARAGGFFRKRFPNLPLNPL